MATYNFAAMVEAAKAEGFSTELLDPGTYDAEVTHASFGQTSKGGDQFSLRWKVLNGPKAGESVWQNINFPKVDAAGNPENPKAVPPFLRKVAALGLDVNTMEAAPGGLAGAIGSRVGMQKSIAVSHKAGDSKTFVEVAIKGDVTGAVQAPVPPVPVATAPAVPVATAAPAAVPAPAPAPAAVPEESDEVKALKAQLAAAQAAAGQAGPAPAASETAQQAAPAQLPGKPF